LLAVAACAAPVKPTTATWTVPPGWRTEVIPFPLDFAPTLAHHGVEELRFPPGFMDPASPARWSYVFAWRLDDAAALTPDALAGELTVYFSGLVHAVDANAREPTKVNVAPNFAVTAHLEDAFTTKEPIDLTGRATRLVCGSGALWVIALSPPTSGIRPQLDELASAAACGQTLPAK
jgi:hypothetical protein